MDAPYTLIRPMTLADCDRVSEIRVRGWQHAYRGLVPQPYLDELSVTADAERRRSRFGQGDGSAVNLVAEQDGRVLGWAASGPYRGGAAHTGDAELYAIYVDPAQLGRGIGRALLAASVERCTPYPRMLLWVLRGNVSARRFYERAGFRADGAEEPFDAGGVPVSEVRYARSLRG
ncbi:GNAT family N-acetyltransferase [Streptomyces sp. 5-8]|uniref:GNAT family N-acetyltransferase n=1 Tax=Streptomyces musisoli TaxID=2802280 RepID=A0ABS1NU50_9ACTN|nr:MULTISPECIES: GNAT family N-acetyltransferase [Streptomyces]MBL1103387.1 GNAT family N-acetyltransferase [Streptomyces musisoli]MBY8840008.1 GNAT family N-acetyltransferase [Streptomyces sp. SP2-10]